MFFLQRAGRSDTKEYDIDAKQAEKKPAVARENSHRRYAMSSHCKCLALFRIERETSNPSKSVI